jgi:hypothetical protein
LDEERLFPFGEQLLSLPSCSRLGARLADEWRVLEHERMAIEPEIEVHRVVYADAYEQSWRGLRSPAGAPAVADRVAEVVVHYVREEQAVLASAAALQEAINALLDRPRPTRALCVPDLHILFTMHTGSTSAFPYLFETLEDELGFGVACTADAAELTRRPGPRVTPAARPVDSGAHACTLSGNEHNQQQRRTP